MDVNGLTLAQLARSTRSRPNTLSDILREEIAAGRVEVIRSHAAVYRLTRSGRAELEPISPASTA